MTKKFTGIVIEVSQIGADKNLTLLTAEEGLVNIQVENSGENILKFSFAKEVFTFGYFEVLDLGGFLYNLERCTVLETFEEIKTSSHKKAEAVNVIAVVKEIAQYNDKDTPLFYELISAFKILNYENLPQNLILTKLLSSICASFAQKLNFDLCASCQTPLNPPVYLNFENNVFVCPHCKSKNYARLNISTFQTLQKLLNTPYQNLKTLKLANFEKLLQLLKENYRFKVSERFKFYCE